jgi:hypothetical protein
MIDKDTQDKIAFQRAKIHAYKRVQSTGTRDIAAIDAELEELQAHRKMLVRMQEEAPAVIAKAEERLNVLMAEVPPAGFGRTRDPIKAKIKRKGKLLEQLARLQAEMEAAGIDWKELS